MTCRTRRAAASTRIRILIFFDEKDVCLQKSEAIGFQIVPFAEIRKLAEAGKFLHYTRILEAFDSEGYVPEL